MAISDLRFTHFIKDPIWGEIPLTNIEWDLINTQAFSRLRHIRQMGVAYLGFPAANHRRYEHSLGTMHVAYLLFDTLYEDLPIEVKDEIIKGTSKSKEAQSMFR